MQHNSIPSGLTKTGIVENYANQCKNGKSAHKEKFELTTVMHRGNYILAPLHTKSTNYQCNPFLHKHQEMKIKIGQNNNFIDIQSLNFNK